MEWRRVSAMMLMLVLPFAVVLALLAQPARWRDALLLALLAVIAIAIGQLVVTQPQTILPGRRTSERILRTLLLVAAITLTQAAVFLWLKDQPFDRWTGAGFFCAGLFSGAVGFGELIARYRDNPDRLLGAPATAAYIAVNVAAGVAALALVRHFEVFGQASTPNAALKEVLLASFGAIAFFRSSLFTARIGEADIGIGPSTLLKALLESTDRLVNRAQAEDRAEDVGNCMAGIDFDKAKVALPALCFVLYEGLTPAEQTAVANQIADLAAQTIDPFAKSRILGVYLLRQVGASVLARAVHTLGNSIRVTPA